MEMNLSGENLPVLESWHVNSLDGSQQRREQQENMQMGILWPSYLLFVYCFVYCMI